MGLGGQTRACLRLVVPVLLVVLLTVFYFYNDVTTQSYLPIFSRREESDTFTVDSLNTDMNETIATTEPKEGFLVWSPSCRIPDIDPWHVSIRRFIKRPKPLVCSKLPPLTAVSYDPHTDSHTLHVVKEALPKYSSPKKLQCCYIDITRKDMDVTPKTIKAGGADNVYTMSECYPFNMSVELSSSQEFLKVKCSTRKGKSKKEVYANMHAIVAKTPGVQAVLDTAKDTNKENKLSILLLGIDSISRMNLYRSMPSVAAYLKKQDWLEMKGYNKMDDNTFPNLMAILAGMSDHQVYSTCFKGTNRHLDWCPLLWNNFSSAGYVTAYMEDSPAISTFNYLKKGFIQTPTNYYSRPFMLAAYKHMRIKPKSALATCIGSTPTSELVWKYVIDLVTVFHNSLYFALFWLNNFSHNDVNTPATAEARVLKFLKELSSSTALNSSLIVFFSDHGIRFGPIRETYVGWFEERLPFIYIWVPEWYRRLHPDKYTSLQLNRNRLTSPYDLRLTLLEILDDTEHNGTMGCPRCQSLFHEVPWNRSCEDAGITDHWCTCFQYHDVTEGSTYVLHMANFVVKSMNNALSQGKHLTDTAKKCAVLRVKRIHSVRSKIISFRKSDKDYVIVFETLPGEAIFEASVRHSGPELKLIDTVSRLNAYGSQSSCIHDSYLRKYCVCYKISDERTKHKS